MGLLKNKDQMIDQSKLYSDEQWQEKWIISGFKFLNYEGKRGRGI